MTEDDLEQLALTWFQDSGWDYLHGPDIAPDSDTPERSDYRQVLLPSTHGDTFPHSALVIAGVVLDKAEGLGA